MIIANAMNANETKAIFCLRTPIRLFLDTSPDGSRLDVVQVISKVLPKCDLVVSDTTKPNFTLREKLFENLDQEKSIVLISHNGTSLDHQL